MQFISEDLKKFDDSGKNVCVYSPDLLELFVKYTPKDFPEFSSRLFYFWKKQKRPIPVSVAIKLMNENNVEKINIKSFSVGSGNRIIPPEHNSQFFYFLGLLLGDGCLVHRKRGQYKNMYHVQISFATKKEAGICRSIVNRLFEINSSIYLGKGCYNLCIYSKPLVILLNSIYDIPIGEKYSKLHVPKLIKFSSRSLISYFLKGVFDSDGNIYRYRKGKSVQLRQHSESFIRELRELFSRVGIDFRPPYYDKANNSWVLWTSKKDLVDNFIKKIINLKLQNAPVAQPG